MLLVNTESIPGKEIEAISLVTGAFILSKHIGNDIGAGFRTLVGGKMNAYTDMLDRSKEEALAQMQREAQRLGADAVVGIRFATSSIMQGAAEVLAYGTAVRILS